MDVTEHGALLLAIRVFRVLIGVCVLALVFGCRTGRSVEGCGMLCHELASMGGIERERWLPPYYGWLFGVVSEWKRSMVARENQLGGQHGRAI